MNIIGAIKKLKEPYLYKKINDYISKNTMQIDSLKDDDSSQEKIFKEIDEKITTL